MRCWDFPGGPVVKNPPSNTGDVGSMPGRGTKILHAAGHLSPHAATTEPTRSGAHMPQLQRPRAATTELAHSRARATTREKPAHRNERSLVPQLRPDTAKTNK